MPVPGKGKECPIDAEEPGMEETLQQQIMSQFGGVGGGEALANCFRFGNPEMKAIIGLLHD